MLILAPNKISPCRVSGLLALSTEVAGSSFGAKLGILQIGSAKRSGASAGFSSIGASFGATLPSGLTVSGAWARGSDMKGMLMDDVKPTYADVWTSSIPDGAVSFMGEPVWRVAVKKTDDTTNTYVFIHHDVVPTTNEVVAETTIDQATGEEIPEGYTFVLGQTPVEFVTQAKVYQTAIKLGMADNASVTEVELAATAQKNLDQLIEDFSCTPLVAAATVQGSADDKAGTACTEVLDKAGSDAMQYMVDPSYFQVEVGYKFGNTGVAVSWYQSKDFVMEGSEGTAIGLGARHTFPKAGADIYAAVENFSVTPMTGAKSKSGTVFMLGTKVWF